MAISEMIVLHWAPGMATRPIASSFLALFIPTASAPFVGLMCAAALNRQMRFRDPPTDLIVLKIIVTVTAASSHRTMPAGPLNGTLASLDPLF